MNYEPSTKQLLEKIQQVLQGIVLLSWLVLGNGGLGIASEPHSLLQIQGESITGVLTQVPLRIVLEQLHENLAIEYNGPGEELDKLVSANLTGETVSNSLSKILAPWDYALQVDQQGRVHQIFVVTKMRPIEIEKNEPKTAGKVQGGVSPMVKSEPVLKPSNPNVLLAETEVTSHLEMDAMSSPNFLGTSEQTHPMVIHLSQGGPMSIQPSSNFMQVIPASGYPPMDILPVSEDAQREFIGGHN